MGFDLVVREINFNEYSRQATGGLAAIILCLNLIREQQPIWEVTSRQKKLSFLTS